MPAVFDLQGHRGARGLKPENTLPAFEAALDLGVTTIETDLHLTRDDVAVLFHDEQISPGSCRRAVGAKVPEPASKPRVRSLSLAQLQDYLADQYADAVRYPTIDASVTPLARWYAEQQGVHPYAPPTLADLFAFAAAYSGAPGARAGKSDTRRQRAGRVRFALELKRIPYHPEVIGDDFAGAAAGVLEQRVVEAVRTADVLPRVSVIGFDHRSLRAIRQLEPRLTTAVCIYNTAPVDPAELVRQADAQGYGPDYHFLDEMQVRQLHAAGFRVVPWTVNEPRDWERLLAWGVDGIATDFPDGLAALLRQRGIEF